MILSEHSIFWGIQTPMRSVSGLMKVAAGTMLLVMLLVWRYPAHNLTVLLQGEGNTTPGYRHQNETHKQPRCSQEARHRRLYAACGRTPAIEDMSRLSDREVRRIASNLQVVEDLKVITCIHYKVAFSTLGSILTNNSLPEPLPPNATGDFRLIYKKFSALDQPEVSTDDIRFKLKNYFKFFFTRHPFDRILSAYRDKIVVEREDGHGNYYRQIMPRVLTKLNITWSSDELRTMDFPFSYIPRFLFLGGNDLHLKGPYEQMCSPCILRYDYIGKIETFDDDIEYIVNKHMKGRGVGTRKNSWSNTNESSKTFNKTLGEYRDIPDHIMKALDKRYEHDMQQYGYTNKKVPAGLQVSCDTEDCC